MFRRPLRFFAPKGQNTTAQGERCAALGIFEAQKQRKKREEEAESRAKENAARKELNEALTKENAARKELNEARTDKFLLHSENKMIRDEEHLVGWEKLTARLEVLIDKELKTESEKGVCREWR